MCLAIPHTIINQKKARSFFLLFPFFVIIRLKPFSFKIIDLIANIATFKQCVFRVILICQAWNPLQKWLAQIGRLLHRIEVVGGRQTHLLHDFAETICGRVEGSGSNEELVAMQNVLILLGVSKANVKAWICCRVFTL